MVDTYAQPKNILQQTYGFWDACLLPICDWPDLLTSVEFRRQAPRSEIATFSDTLPAIVYHALGGDLSDVVPMNACWLLHMLAARVFDDLQDEEGRQHPWIQGGSGKALPIGIGLLSLATVSLTHLRCDGKTLAALLNRFGQATTVAARAQSLEPIRDLTSGALERYFAHIGGTTAEVFATGAWAGGRLWSNSPNTLQALYDFGYNYGLFTAIIDDCLDLGDAARGRFRLPVLYAASRQDHPAYSELMTLLTQPGLVPDATQIQHLLSEIGAIPWSVGLAISFQQRAFNALTALPTSAQEALIHYATP